MSASKMKMATAVAREKRKRIQDRIESRTTIDSIVSELVSLQKRRERFLKLRNSLANNLRSAIAQEIFGYHAGLPEKERKKKMKEATEYIKRVANGEEDLTFATSIRATSISIDSWDGEIEDIGKVLKGLAARLPVADWARKRPEHRGFDLLGLAMIVGETGDLTNYGPEVSDNPDKSKRMGYYNPSRIWRRMGCSPWEYGDETHMGSTWRRLKTLPKEQWKAFGYVKHRRCIIHRIVDPLIKCNKDGPYRTHYLEIKREAFEKHPDWNWTDCDKCEGTGKESRKTCKRCQGLGKKSMHAHRHASLLTGKLLLLNLWIEWNKT